MPWKVVSSMSLRQELIARASQGESITALARAYGVSRKTVYKWLARSGEERGLADRSHRPHASPHQTAPAIEAQVLVLRHAHPTWGGRKIHHRLRAEGMVTPPAPSTITGILHRHGLIAPDQPPATLTRFVAAAPNDLWQMDFKGWHPSRTGRIYPLTVEDDHSRFLLPLTCLPDERGAPVRAALTAMFQRYGLPWALLCDNGKPWGASGSGGITKLEVWCMQLDIRMIHGRILHPQTQGKLERLHRTLKAEVFAHHTFADLAQAQAACDRFRKIYNLERPHEMLDYATPVSRYRASERPFPATLPQPVYADDVLVRRVSAKGTIRFRNRHIPISEGLAGHEVGVRPTAVDGTFDVLFHQVVVRVIALNTLAPVLSQV
jgi:transposase InsO family protein